MTVGPDGHRSSPRCRAVCTRKGQTRPSWGPIRPGYGLTQCACLTAFADSAIAWSDRHRCVGTATGVRVSMSAPRFSWQRMQASDWRRSAHLLGGSSPMFFWNEHRFRNAANGVGCEQAVLCPYDLDRRIARFRVRQCPAIWFFKPIASIITEAIYNRINGCWTAGTN